jgi:hypothetical protein
VKRVLAALLAFFLTSLPAAVEAQPPETATVAFRSELPRVYHLERVRISVDGYVWADGPVAMVRPGTHDVTVEAEFSCDARSVRACGRYIANHRQARQARFSVRSSEHVRTPAGRVLLVRAVELSGDAPLEKRVQMRWSTTVP